MISSAGTDAKDLKIEEYLTSIKSPDPHIRQAACQSLGQASFRGDPRTAPALIKGLQDRDTYVRQAAASALGQASRRGDESVLDALVARLTDADASVRRVVANAIGQVSPRGCVPAILGLAGRLEDRDGGVRRSAIKALEKVAEKEDAKVLTALFTRTADGEAFVRHTAVEVLSRLAEEGNVEVVDRMLELLNTDRDARVRWAATEALGRLAVRGDSRVLGALLARLDDEADSVRRAAANALGHVTFAPLQELELQEKHIQELEFRGHHELTSREKTISELRAHHAQEVAKLRQRVDELEETLRREIHCRDEQIARLEEQVLEQGWASKVTDFLPHAGHVSRFLDTLPDLAGPSSYGSEIVAPVWALRCMRGSGPCALGGVSSAGSASGTVSSLPGGGGEDSSPFGRGKDRRSLLALFELFEQLSSGTVTPMQLTEGRPLDVYVHQAEDNTWGLFCSSRHRHLAFLMRQACLRNELLTVRCVLRPKEDLSFWGWQWYNFYDGADGRTVEPKSGRPMAGSSRSCSPTSSAGRLTGVARPGSSPRLAVTTSRSGSSPRLVAGGSSSPSTPRTRSAAAKSDKARLVSTGAHRTSGEPVTPKQVAIAAAVAAAGSFNGDDGQRPRSPRSNGSLHHTGSAVSTTSTAALMGRGRNAAARQSASTKRPKSSPTSEPTSPRNVQASSQRSAPIA